MSHRLHAHTVVTQEYYNSDPSADNLAQLKSKIDDTKSVMVENIGACVRACGACARCQWSVGDVGST